MEVVAPQGPTMALNCLVIPHGASNPRMYCACTSSPRLNSSTTPATYTQVVSGHCPKVSFTNTSFRMRRISSDAICRLYGMARSPSGSPTVMSSLTTVTDAPVLMVTRYTRTLSHICPSALQLSSLCFSAIPCV